MKRIAAALVGVLWVVAASGSAWAAQMNFKPANRSGDAPAPEYSEARVAAKEKKKQQREPGFWDKEYERSGLKGNFGKMQENMQGAGNVFNGEFFKNQEEKYRARHPKTS